MKVTRKSIYTDIDNTMDVNLTEEQFDAWRNKDVSALTYTHLTPVERDFLTMGMTPAEWATIPVERDYELIMEDEAVDVPESVQ